MSYMSRNGVPFSCVLQIEGHYFIWQLVTVLLRRFRVTAGCASLAASPTRRQSGSTRLVQRLAVDVRVLLAIFKVGAGNIFARLADARSI